MIKSVLIAALMVSSACASDALSVKFSQFQRPAAQSTEEVPQTKSWSAWGLDLAKSAVQSIKGEVQPKTEQQLVAETSKPNTKQLISDFMDNAPCITQSSLLSMPDLDLKTTNSPVFASTESLRDAFVNMETGRQNIRCRVAKYELSHELNRFAIGATALAVCVAPWTLLIAGSAGFAGFTVYKSGQMNNLMTKDSERIQTALIECKKTLGLGASASSFMKRDTVIRPMYSHDGRRLIYDAVFPNPMVPILSVHFRLELDIVGTV